MVFVLDISTVIISYIDGVINHLMTGGYNCHREYIKKYRHFTQKYIEVRVGISDHHSKDHECFGKQHIA